MHPEIRLLQKHPHGRGEDFRPGAVCINPVETPPRAWGRHSARRHILPRSRNTPTGVGKTALDIDIINIKQKHPHGRGEDVHQGKRRVRWPKHPHGRGEDAAKPRFRQAGTETPPRAWGRPDNITGASTNSRNTPTGVGKTYIIGELDGSRKKHPHGRGEDILTGTRVPPPVETPPRAWGRPVHKVRHALNNRNTPTGVGKTSWL